MGNNNIYCSQFARTYKFLDLEFFSSLGPDKIKLFWKIWPTCVNFSTKDSKLSLMDPEERFVDASQSLNDYYQLYVDFSTKFSPHVHSKHLLRIKKMKIGLSRKDYELLFPSELD